MNIVVLTPDTGFESSRWHANCAYLLQTLTDHGHRARHCPWDRWRTDGRADLVLPLLVWGYHLRWPQFRRRVTSSKPLRAIMQNSAELVLWNADKRYLLELQKRGCDVIATAHALRLDARHLHSLAEAWNADTLVIKPAVSASAWRTMLWERGNAAPNVPRDACISESGWLVQPFRPEIRTEGEISLIYFDGAYSHAVRKTIDKDRNAEFRIQAEFGGETIAYDAEQGLIAFGERVLRTLPSTPLYARVDVVLTPQPLLMELELIEPDLFLRHHADAPARFARAASDFLNHRIHSEQPI